MSEQKVMNRGFVVLGAILIQLALGAIYAWSVFTPMLEDANWTKAETQYVFAAGLAFFAIVMVLAGRMMPKVGPKKLAISGGIVLGLGYILGGLLGGTNTVLLILFIGVIGGSGIGLAYVVPIAVGMRWFPDKKGLITGLAVAGFGFGAMLWVKLAGEWGDLLANFGLGTTLAIYGVVFFVMVVIGGMWMVFPPDGWQPKGYVPPEAKTGQTTAAADVPSNKMLKTPQFYMIFLTFVFSGGAGLMTSKRFEHGKSPSKRNCRHRHGSLFLTGQWPGSHWLGYPVRQIGPQAFCNYHVRYARRIYDCIYANGRNSRLAFSRFSVDRL